ncbi:hypothetical protein RCL_jg23727.t1 [Rhizophagus clarus]|uniref:Uncharacterized protein n=1 Tax=Rhizophagus clarus TaxID=94130 RepID=A0A8H3LQC1_9GLOM|nr:hypothetical protein RCL_jg23727.t1 [Rhizophagus clarus]
MSIKRSSKNSAKDKEKEFLDGSFGTFLNNAYIRWYPRTFGTKREGQANFEKIEVETEKVTTPSPSTSQARSFRELKLEKPRKIPSNELESS